MISEFKCKTCKKIIDEELYKDKEGFCKRCFVILEDRRLSQKKTLINFEDYISKDKYGKTKIKKN